MNKRVGIPGGLYFYKFYPLWESFFNELGMEAVTSIPSCRKILDDGVNASNDEACLPVKMYHGHVIHLKDRVDMLFIPRLTSISKNEYICPKIGGLPDMIRHAIKNLPPVIDVEINLRDKEKSILEAVYKIARISGISKNKAKSAYSKALSDYRAFREKVKRGVLPTDILEKKIYPLPSKRIDTYKVLLLGHQYNIYDAGMNMNIIKKLKNKGVEVVTIDMSSSGELREYASTLNKKMFWNFGTLAIGMINKCIRENNIDGIVYVMTFGCGIDSFVCSMAERRIRKFSEIPFTVITLDEHTGEAGVDTRIEAFTDMISWRRADENNFSAPG